LPQGFGSIADVRAFCQRFFEWYNREHRHSGIAMMTPMSVHVGNVDQIVQRRTATLEVAHRLHPERFVRGAPAPQRRPGPAWIDPPAQEHLVGPVAAH